MRITIGTPERQIPHIIHGISANTLFYLINYEKYILNRTYDSNNYTGIDIPHDVDDFSRIDNAYTCFGWNEKDIEKAKETAKKLNLPRKFEKFLDRFYEFKDYYEDNDYDEFYALYLTILEEEWKTD